jgi:isopentenyl diphosphate isomerase/L-lactate dehydrogenase-like FMN-dependent dehydrogenase
MDQQQHQCQSSPPPRREKLVSLADAERRAVALLPPMVLGYYASGAEDEATLRENLTSWRRWRILPRVLVDVSRVDTRVELEFCSRRRGGGENASSRKSSSSRLLQLSAPILVAPMAMMKLAHPQGEVAMARAARAAGLGMVVSTMGTTRLEDVAEAFSGFFSRNSKSSSSPPPPSPPLLFQLYVTKDRAFCELLVRRAEATGYDALVVTVDVPVLGKREADERLGFGLPPGLELANLKGLSDSGSGSKSSSASVGASSRTMTTTGPETRNKSKSINNPNENNDGSRLAALFQRQIDASLTFEFLKWLRSKTTLPIWVKGVLHPDDASVAVAAGADGIVVSNHGGRQLDGAPAAADVLEAVVAAVRRCPGGTRSTEGGGDRSSPVPKRRHVPVLVDGGIRRGSDVLRALALGADAVLLGRPALYGLALDGERGALEALELLKAELERAMALSGCARVSDVCRGLLLSPGEVPMKPRL